MPFFLLFVFFFNDTATTEIYTLSLHDALPALQLRLVRPTDLVEAAVERHGVIAAVELVLAFERRDGGDRVGHLGGRHEIAPAKFDAIDREICGGHVEEPLAEEVGLEAPGTAIGPDRRLVGH